MEKVHGLLYDAGKDSEGIHSIEINGNTIVLMFEDIDDAFRYSGLLEAQDFPTPTVEEFSREEIEEFCSQSGYDSKFVSKGFIPKTEEDRLLLVPPEANREVSDWNDQDYTINEKNLDEVDSNISELDKIRKKLEGLL